MSLLAVKQILMRLVMSAAGAGLLVAANPEHAGGSLAHACWAGAGFAALAAWPGGARRRGPSVPWGLRPAVSVLAAGLMLGLLAWFLAELVAEGGQIGLAERVMGVAQAGWPLVVVLSCRLSQPPRPDASRNPLGGRPVALSRHAAACAARTPASGNRDPGRSSTHPPNPARRVRRG